MKATVHTYNEKGRTCAPSEEREIIFCWRERPQILDIVVSQGCDDGVIKSVRLKVKDLYAWLQREMKKKHK